MPPRAHVQLHPPLSEAPWSPDFVSQSLELLTLYLRDGGITYLQPECAVSLRLGWPKSRQPGDVVMRALQQYGFTPRVVHSTSWRQDDDRLVLTYVGIIEPADAPDGLDAVPIARAELARGEATAPPPVIGVEQVVEHALRHLSWLVKDDPVIREELADWASVLEGYEPEPFRSFRADQG